MTTEEIIDDLRQNGLTSASIYTRMERAANRLEELERANKSTLADLALALSERTPHDYGLLKKEATFLRKERDKALAEVERVRKLWNESHIAERDDFAKEIERVKAECANQQLNTRPEPSRLEIAAMLLAAMCGSQYTWSNAEGIALRKADTLIAAAKEAK